MYPCVTTPLSQHWWVYIPQYDNINQIEKGENPQKMKNKDKKLDIKCITKAGSSLQCNLFAHMKNIHDVNSIRFKRIKPPTHGEWLQDVMAADIVILRNPVNRMISTYYSLGWTHQTDNFKKDNIEQREEIKSTTLGEWITSAGRLRNIANVYNSILEVKQDSIMRYEDIMDNGKGYLHLILKR